MDAVAIDFPGCSYALGVQCWVRLARDQPLLLLASGQLDKEVRVPALGIERFQGPESAVHLLLLARALVAAVLHLPQPFQVLVVGLFHSQLTGHDVGGRELAAIEGLDQDALAFENESNRINVIFVHRRRLRHDNGTFIIAIASFAVPQPVLKTAGPTHHESEASHGHVDLHLLGDIVPLIGANDVNEYWRLHLSINEGVSVSVFSILLPELVCELNQLIEVATEVDDGVLYGPLRIVYLPLQFGLLLDNP